MNTEQKDSFSFFAPIKLEKSSKDGTTIMKMKGVASTGAQDEDKEWLDPNGFELDYFVNDGYMNWNHQTNKEPLAIIGKPTLAEVKKGKMNVECQLFEKNPIARDVYKLGEILEEQGLNLGFSIEGKVIERDKKDPRKVKKAKITGCAITPNPKNKETVAQIIKSYEGNDLNIIKGMYSAYEESTEEERDKALSAESSSGQAISKESLDGNVKDLTDKEKEKRGLSKGEVVNQLISRLPNNSGKQIELVYNLIEKIEKRKQMEDTEVTISQEAIEKAFEALGVESLEKGETTKDDEETSEETTSEASSNEEPNVEPETSSEEETTEEEEKEDVEKAMTGGSKDNKDGMGDKTGEEETYMKYKGKKYMYKAGGYYMMDGKKYKMEKGKMMPYEDKMKKAEESDINNDSTPDLVKGLSDLMKSQFENQEIKLNDKFKAVGTIQKGLEDEMGKISKRLEDLENSPNPEKSIRTKKFIEKSYDNGTLFTEDGQKFKQMSVRDNKAQLLNILDEESGISKGEITDEQLANDVCVYEASGTVSKRIQEIALKKGIQLVQ